MIQEALNRLELVIATLPAAIGKIDEQIFTLKKNPKTWSKKEILGHLIDSASNNHHRFIRAQYEDAPAISYDQDLWVKENGYQQMETQQLVAFWVSYNKLLLEMISRMTANKLAKQCRLADDTLIDLNDLFVDYVNHLTHHVSQLTKN